MRHIIGKKTFEITATSLPAAQHWERKSTDIVNDIITPCIESCFDQIVGGSTDHLILDSIEIDLGEISESNFRQMIPERLKKALFAFFDEIVLPPYDPSVDPVRITSKRPLPPFQMSSRDIAVCSLLYFLKTGLLPWWLESSDMVWSVEWIAGLSAKDKTRIVEVVAQEPVARERIVQQFDDSFLSVLVAWELHLSQQDVVDILEALNHGGIAVSRQFRMHFRQDFWHFWINAAISKKVSSEVIDSFTDFILQDKIIREAVRQFILSGETPSSNEVGSSDFSRRVMHAVFQEVRQHHEIRNQLDTESKEQPSLQTFAEKDSTITNRSENTPPAPPPPQEFSTGTGQEKRIEVPGTTKSENQEGAYSPEVGEIAEIAREGIFVQHAGIILLHPFFQELFKECGLWHDGRWRETISAHKAVHLLAWLGSGAEHAPEYLLPLHKILCGVQLDEPLETAFELQPKDFASCTELLVAAISHWKAIGKTSPDGLREGFLQRHGKLQRQEKNWQLTVEKKTQDVLLSKLPWGFSIIHFPWMKGGRVYVDWT